MILPQLEAFKLGSVCVGATYNVATSGGFM